MLTRNIVFVTNALLVTLFCTAVATAQFMPYGQQGFIDRPYPEGPLKPTILPYPGGPGYPAGPTYPTGPSVPGSPGTGDNPAEMQGPAHESNASLAPLGCYIADKKESCLGKFGLQQPVFCTGCNPDNVTCPSARTYAIPTESISQASWDKNRATTIKPSASGYVAHKLSVALCGKVGECAKICHAHLIHGNIFYGCPKVPESELDIRIDYMDLSVQCPFTPVAPVH